jgi:hypothetical protein
MTVLCSVYMTWTAFTLRLGEARVDPASLAPERLQ